MNNLRNSERRNAPLQKKIKKYIAINFYDFYLQR